jgi:hypothetical protein
VSTLSGLPIGQHARNLIAGRSPISSKAIVLGFQLLDNSQDAHSVFNFASPSRRVRRAFRCVP